MMLLGLIKSGKGGVISPATDVAAMSKSDVVSSGAFGLVFGLERSPICPARRPERWSRSKDR